MFYTHRYFIFSIINTNVNVSFISLLSSFAYRSTLLTDFKKRLCLVLWYPLQNELLSIRYVHIHVLPF